MTNVLNFHSGGSSSIQRRLDIPEAVAGLKINPLAALLAPLAGLALLGAASAVAVNPVLLKLTTIRGARDADTARPDQQLRVRLRQLRLLETFLSSLPGKKNKSKKSVQQLQ